MTRFRIETDIPSILTSSACKTWISTASRTTLTSGLKSTLKLVFVGVAAFTFFLSLSPAYANGSNGAFLVSKGSASAPGGFSGLCSKYKWACASAMNSGMSSGASLRLAKAVNDEVNRKTRSIEDRAQYGREEYWTLPSARGGDCEDFALLKKKRLVERGVGSNSLLIATVLDRRLQSHAVLVIRTAQGDFVLDNLNKNILRWNETGYTFLKMQNPNSLGNWDAVLAGGVITENPTASR